MKSIFDDMVQHSYSLHAILVHDGDANSGHYWAYLRLYDKWYQFNDMNVSEIEQEEVMAVSLSQKTESNACAYCLIYVDTSNFHLQVLLSFISALTMTQNASDDFDPLYWANVIPSHLTQEISNNNEKLHREIIKYEEEQRRKKFEELRTFSFNFAQRLREVYLIEMLMINQINIG